MTQPHRILVVLGTRPEAIKLVPVIGELRSRPDRFTVTVVATSQHRDMVDPILEFFGISLDHDLDIMSEGQGPADVTARVLASITEVYRQERPDLVVVQGDTSTAAAAALAAFYEKIPVAHVEAGLRTGDRWTPFPEEMNRRLLAQIASLHFAPTESNRENLLREGVDPASVFVTGNTVIDALGRITEKSHLPDGRFPEILARGSRIFLLTTHRRENHGEPQRNIFEAINLFLKRNRNVEVIFPIHPNPAVVSAVEAHLAPHPRLHLTGPLSYIDFISLMSRSFAVVSDSGGVQEEAPALGVPVVVLRGTTEREEAVRSGNAMLVELKRDSVLEAIERLLNDGDLYAAMSRKSFPFGAGGAAAEIVRIIDGMLGKGARI